MKKIIQNCTFIFLFTPYILHAHITVGSLLDEGCDYFDLQEALDSGEDELKLTNSQTFLGHYTVESQNITVRGGYNTCEDANLGLYDGVSVTEIGPKGSGHIFSIQGDGSESFINLENLKINNSVQGSGVRVSNLNGTFKLINSEISNNQGVHGAGLYLSGADLYAEVIGSQVLSNQADQLGGGIYCSQATVKIDSGSLIANNQVFGSVSTGMGGGLYAKNCDVQSFAGNSDGLSAGFINNQSTEDGAGIYAENTTLTINGQGETASVPGFGDVNHPALFKNNLSDSDDNGSGAGASIYLRNSTAHIQAVWFDANQGSPSGEGSFNHGSVFEAYLGSSVTMTRDLDQPCWREGLCNLVSNNTNIAISISRAPTSVSVFDTEFTQNTVNWTGLIHVTNNSSFNLGEGPYLTMENNLVHHNNSPRVGLLKTNSSIPDHCCIQQIKLVNNTIAYNNFTDEILDINDDVDFDLHGNIIYEPVNLNPVMDVFNSAFVNTNISCLLAHDVSSLPDINISTVVGDPLFEDSDGNDFHITLDSPAVDFCSDSLYEPSRMDVDGQPRSNDLAEVENLEGFIDLGFDEYYSPDLIFSHGFD